MRKKRLIGKAIKKYRQCRKNLQKISPNATPLNIYSEESALTASTQYFKGDELAAKVFLQKYALRDERGALKELTPKCMHKRITDEIIAIEKILYPKHALSEDVVFRLLDRFQFFVPAGSPMYGIGNYYQNVSIGNCFAIGNAADSYGGIMQIDEQLVQIMKRRGGVGIDLSHLRPKGKPVSNAAKTTSGLSSFVNRYTHSTSEVAQDGRRGALMLSCDVEHPDIMDFINCKSDHTVNNSANISVRVSDAFMHKALTKPEGPQRKVLQEVCDNAWRHAEPGILFWDQIIDNSPADCYDQFGTITTNPCGELPLSPYDSCRLGHMNVFSYVRQSFTNAAWFDDLLFVRDVAMAQRIMDDMIDIELTKIVGIIDKIQADPEPDEIKQAELSLWEKVFESAYLGRRTGLGMTGIGDAVAAMGLKYGTDQATTFIENITHLLSLASYNSSVNLAGARGAFPVFNHKQESSGCSFLERIFSDPGFNFAGYKKYGRRNIANLTIAPTGTVSILTQTSSGIEPVFSLRYNRKKMGAYGVMENFEVVHPKYQDYLQLEDENKIPDPYLGATAMDINVYEKIIMQGKVQKYIDHSISVTHNLPSHTPREQMLSLVESAWVNGCKGFTVYRDGCREGVLTTDKARSFEYIDAIRRPKTLECDIHLPVIKGQKWIVLIGLLENKPYEVFAFVDQHCGLAEGKGKITKIKKGVYKLEADNITIEDVVGMFGRPEEEFITRLISSNLRHRADLKFVYEQLNKAPGDIVDFSRVIARILRKYIPSRDIKITETCKCGGDFEYQGGCLICKSCGHSKCE